MPRGHQATPGASCGPRGIESSYPSSPAQQANLPKAPTGKQNYRYLASEFPPLPTVFFRSRFTAGAAGFLNLSRSGERPDR
jgi:hypothetical protein